jgi:hypothetical protein
VRALSLLAIVAGWLLVDERTMISLNETTSGRSEQRCILAGMDEQGRTDAGRQRRQSRERHVLAIEQHAAGNEREADEAERAR